MKINKQLTFPEYFGDFGGIFVPDAFTPDLDRLAEESGKIILSDSFDKNFKAALNAVGVTEIKLARFEIQGGCRVTHTFSQAEYYNIAGQVALGKERQAELQVCGAETAGFALAFAQANLALKTRGKVFLNQKMAENLELIAKLNELGCEIETKTCQELFNIPQMYAFQKYMESRNRRHFVPLEANIGPYPFPALVGYFANIYGKKLVANLSDFPDVCVAQITTGTNAIGVFQALANSNCKLATVEDPVVLEKHGAFCGDFTLFTRQDSRQEANTIICPQLADAWRKGRVIRLGCDHFGGVAPGKLNDLSLSPNIIRAIVLASQEIGGKKILVVEATQ
jgi:tryptophan synthase beta subunit